MILRHQYTQIELAWLLGNQTELRKKKLEKYSIFCSQNKLFLLYLMTF
jgi:hypothetical protein